jgi:hypothetical protein
MCKLLSWWKSLNDRDSDEYRERVKIQAKDQSVYAVQPLVWNGKMYLAYCGVPIVKADDLKDDMLLSVGKAQKNVADYTEEKLMKG